LNDRSVGANVVIYPGVELGIGCTIQDGAVIGKPLVLGPHSRVDTPSTGSTVLEDGCSIGCYAVVVAGARIGRNAVVGDHTFIRENASLGAEAILGAGSQVGSGVPIGARSRLMNVVLVGRGSVVEEDVFVGPAVVMTNDPTMGRRGEGQNLEGVLLRRGCRIGAGAIFLPGVEVGEEAIVAAGSLVTRDVAPRTLVMGSPARVSRAVEEAG
jgi:UDP-2-acetamido-3-amino-2,3-dideoxy-glucuronate N-acetyltransferase